VTQRGPSRAAIERINVAVLALLEHEPMTLAEWQRACRPMSQADFKSARLRCKGARMTHMIDRQVRLTQLGYKCATSLAEGRGWRWWKPRPISVVCSCGSHSMCASVVDIGDERLGRPYRDENGTRRFVVECGCECHTGQPRASDEQSEHFASRGLRDELR